MRTKNVTIPAVDQQRIARLFIVVWDDQQGVCAPLGWDEDCEGAICCDGDSVAIFASRKAARKAIDISAKFAALCKAQGRPANDDFIGEGKRNLRVIPCQPNAKLRDAGKSGVK